MKATRNHLVFVLRRSHSPSYRGRLSCQEEKFVLLKTLAVKYSITGNKISLRTVYPFGGVVEYKNYKTFFAVIIKKPLRHPPTRGVLFLFIRKDNCPELLLLSTVR
jgi:hypothetical protein